MPGALWFRGRSTAIPTGVGNLKRLATHRPGPQNAGDRAEERAAQDDQIAGGAGGSVSVWRCVVAERPWSSTVVAVVV